MHFGNADLTHLLPPKKLMPLHFWKKEIMYTLVLRFNNRWRWCSGRFNFRQGTLELGSLRSLPFQVLFSRSLF